ncbi:MAG: hypothetical protein JXA13_02465 [Anaerolineales bacterium]|nr:hypothetical protein [Anaerolineales bacterium]
MNLKKLLVPFILIYMLVTYGCAYIVLPSGVEKPVEVEETDTSPWVGLVTNVGQSDTGGLRIDLSIRNDTGDWSTMRANEDKPVVLTSKGNKTNCETVFVGTGNHRLAPGFQVRGYTSDANGSPETQLLYIECDGVDSAAGATLTIDYIYFVGPLDYYVEIEETNKKEAQMEINLDEIASNLTYPIGLPVEGLIQDSEIEIVALSDNVITLQDVQRSSDGIQFTWQNHNPTKFPLKTHIGIPPVVGNDGIIYGVYETLDMPSVPLTPAGSNVEWTTDVPPVPEEISSLYILLSVESNKPRTYVNYLLDISDK